MPRPTPAQFAYGALTVVCSTFAMLLLSQARSGLAVVVIAVAALALGLLVALTAPLASRSARMSRTSRPSRVTASSATRGARAEPVPVAGGPSGAGAPARVPQASLRR